MADETINYVNQKLIFPHHQIMLLHYLGNIAPDLSAVLDVGGCGVVLAGTCLLL